MHCTRVYVVSAGDFTDHLLDDPAFRNTADISYNLPLSPQFRGNISETADQPVIRSGEPDIHGNGFLIKARCVLHKLPDFGAKHLYAYISAREICFFSEIFVNRVFGR